MFSLQKQISKFSPKIFIKNDLSQYDIFSLNYSLVFHDLDSNIDFFKSIAFYFCLDKYNKKIYASENIIEKNEDTKDLIVVHSDNQLKKISSFNYQVYGESIKYKPFKFLQQPLDYQSSKLEDILNYLQKEISCGYDETIRFLEKNNVSFDENSFIKPLCDRTIKLFEKEFSIKKLNEIHGFFEADIIHNGKYMQSLINDPKQMDSKSIKSFKF
jgi:hypothetical protein